MPDGLMVFEAKGTNAIEHIVYLHNLNVERDQKKETDRLLKRTRAMLQKQTLEDKVIGEGL